MASPPRALLERIVAELAPVSGLRALALVGSHARGTARAGSDVDVALFYDERAPLDLGAVREVAARLHDVERLGPPVVTALYEWGPWVNGGAWLTVGGQRVDLLYRNLDQVRRVVADCQAGRIETHYEQQPPFGYFSWTYLGDLHACRPLHDPAGAIMALRRRVTTYPPTLREAVVRGQLWSAEFTGVHAATYAERGDVVHTVGCLTRIARSLVQVLFAWNEVFFTSDKTALAEIARFAAQPADFAARLTLALAQPGGAPAELTRTVAVVRGLTAETAALCAPLHRSKYPEILG